VLALDLIAAHLVGDFLLQTRWMALNKLEHWQPRLVHVLVYSLPFVLVLSVDHVALGRAALFLGLNFAAHFVIDSRRWASAEWPPKPILVDQALHAATLAALAHLL
jgi:hypothetical protein